MSASRSGGPRVDGGASVEGMSRISYERTMSHNQDERDSVARAAELPKLLDEMVRATARRLLVALPPAKRTVKESGFLQDCVRGRRGVSDTTLVQLLALQARCDAHEAHALSDAIRAVEATLRPAVVPCVFEASMGAEEADVALDRARILYAAEPSPTRATQTWEAVNQAIYMLLRLRDAVAQKMHFKPARIA